MSMFLLLVGVLVPSCRAFQLTPIRGLVTGQAFTSSLLKNINQEFITDDSVIQDIFEYHTHLQWDLVYTRLFGLTLYLQYNLNVNKTNWEHILLYTVYRRRFNAVLTILFILLTRNVQSAA